MLLVYEWRKNRAIRIRTSSLVPAIGMMIFFAGCTPKAEKIIIGKDSCAECRMTIMDPKFGGEIVTTKGRVYKFDDTHCIALFLERRGVELSEIHQTLFVNYESNNSFIDVKDAEFVISSTLKSPMAGNAAAFPNAAAAERKSAQIEGSRVTNWATLYNILVK